MPAAPEAVAAGEAEPRVQLHGERERQDEVAAAHLAEILGRGQERRQHDAVGVHPGRIVHVVEVERVRGGAVGERGRGRGESAPADEPGRAAALLPLREPAVHLGNPGRVCRAADDAECIEEEQLDHAHDLGGQVIVMEPRRLLAQAPADLRRRCGDRRWFAQDFTHQVSAVIRQGGTGCDQAPSGPSR
jgi:hypothetical protein